MNDAPSSGPSLRPGKGRGFCIAMAVLVVVAALGALELWQAALLPTGTMAPAWRLAVARDPGARLSLAELRGKVVVLDFFSLTCPPCRRQADVLEELGRAREREDLVIVGISAGGESAEEIAAHGKSKDIAYPLLLGEGPALDAFRVQTLPTLYVLDRKGIIIATHVGFWPRDDLLEAVDEAFGR